jgi:hypothetical protein
MMSREKLRRFVFLNVRLCWAGDAPAYGFEFVDGSYRHAPLGSFDRSVTLQKSKSKNTSESDDRRLDKGHAHICHKTYGFNCG